MPLSFLKPFSESVQKMNSNFGKYRENHFTVTKNVM